MSASLVSYLVYEQYPVWTAEVALLLAGAIFVGAGVMYISVRVGSHVALATLACLVGLAVDGLG